MRKIVRTTGLQDSGLRDNGTTGWGEMEKRGYGETVRWRMGC